LENIQLVLSKNLKLHRASLGLNQTELANAVGVNIQSYNRWENGLAWPSPESIEALANYFKIPSSELFYDPENTMSLKRAADLLAQHFSSES